MYRLLIITNYYMSGEFFDVITVIIFIYFFSFITGTRVNVPLLHETKSFD